MKKVLILLLGILLLFFSCDVGLGSAIDLEAPELSVSTPLSLSKVKRQVTIKGTCSDNFKVTQVSITNRSTGEHYGNAVISGNNWTANLYLPEGEQELLITAKDAAGNTSVKSSKVILLLVDETAPEGLSWYIDRGNGVQVQLKDKEELENLKLDDAVNKHIPQNEEFTLYGRFYDAMSIDTITLIFSEAGTEILRKTVTAEPKTGEEDNYIGDGKSIYAPSWSFTHDELVARKSSLATGKHYLEVSYYSSDNHENSETRPLPCILWYPESDKPGVQQSGTKKDEVTGQDVLSVNIGSSIPVHFFDDDELEEVYYDFIPETEFTAKGYTLSNLASKKNNLRNKVLSSDLSGRTDWPLQVQAGEITGEYYLLAYAKDKNSKISGRSAKESVRIIKTTVADASNPLLIITSPQENSVPYITAGTEQFDFTGYSYDTSGSYRVRIAYIPGNGEYSTASKREARAKELFIANKNNNAEIKGPNGEIIKSFVFPETKTKESGDRWFRENFNFTFDALNDFGEEKKSLKFFEILLEDTDGNQVFKQFNVAADTIEPEISIASPSENMFVCDYRNEDLLLKFKAIKSTGLGIEESGYKVERKDYEDSLYWTVANGGLKKNGDYYEVTIPKATLKIWAEGNAAFKADVQPIFKFYAEDVLGNKTSDQRTIVLSPLPVLESISVDKISGTYPAGKTPFNFQAKFSDSVKVTGTPRLKLAGIMPADKDYYANYTTGSGTDTLTFELSEIPSDVYTPGDTILFCDLGKIDLNGGTIVTGTAGTGNAKISFVSEKNFWDSKDVSVTTIKREIKLDGVAPEIDDITVTVDGIVRNADGNFYVNKNREIILNAVFTEKVLVSGNPVLTAGGLNFTFQSLDDKTVKFAHKVSDNENAVITCNLRTCISNADFASIKDEAGNSMKAGSEIKDPKVVVDTRAPLVPSINGLPVDAAGKPQKIYNTSPRFTIEKKSSDTDIVKYEYSLNGGLSWQTADGTVTISESGSYILKARVVDRASNVSPVTDGIEIVLNDTFPVVDEISIAKVKGNYPKGETVDFKVFLHDVVEPFAEKDASGNPTAYIIFTDTAGTTGKERIVPVTKSDVRTNKLVFTYTVSDNDDFNGVKITKVDLGKIQDKYKNQASSATQTKIASLLATAPCNRSDIKLDGLTPKLVKYRLGTTEYDYPAAEFTDAHEKISGCANNAFTITLKFSEVVIKESGTIILQRKGNWAIPPVMDGEKFTDLYGKMSVSNREKMVITVTGDGTLINEKLDNLTGMPVGPYQRITHGLKNVGGKAVPDTDTKFVLAYDYGLYDDNDTVKGIRNALKSVDYDKHMLEVRTANVSLSYSDGKPAEAKKNKGDLLTLTFSDVIEDGQEWELIIDADSFHDVTGNPFAGLKSVSDTDTTKKTFALWSNKVSQPVVRVNRYSHGLGAYGLNNSGEEKKITGYVAVKGTTSTGDASLSGRNLKPLGYANVRIDCETPGATIKQQTINGGTALYSAHKFTNNNKNEDDTHKSSIADIAVSSLMLTAGGTKYESPIRVGDTSSDNARFKTARKDYVTAYAEKEGFTSSEPGYEGVFKTVVITYKNNTNDQIDMQGGTSNGGEPVVSGFPLRDATSDRRYSKNCYLYTESGNSYFAWVSYEIVSTNFAILQVRTNYSSLYPSHSYGQLLYLYNYSIWE